MKSSLTLLLGGVMLLVGGTAAQAQSPYLRPGVTPWLGLYRGGGSPNDNYFNLVQPQLNNQAQFQQLHGQVQNNQDAINDLGGLNNAYVTGHQAGFQNHGRYFLTVGAGRNGGGGGGFGIANGASGLGGGGGQIGSGSIGAAALGAAAGFGNIGQGRFGGR